MKKTVYLVLIMMLFSAVLPFSVQAADVLYAAATDGEMKMHILPDETSMEIMSVPSCVKMQLIRSDGPWGLVNINGKCGWLNMSFTRNTYEQAAETTGFSSEKNVKIVSEDESILLYNLPSTDKSVGSTVKYTVPKGTILKVSRQTKSGWALATMRDEYAWVKLENTVPYVTKTEKLTDGEIYYVYVLSGDGNGLRMYQGVGQGVVLALIPDCVKLTVRKRQGKYAYVSYDGRNGWVDINYTVKSLSDAQLNAGAAVNREYVITSVDGLSKIDIISVPENGIVVGSINSGERVFVQRSFQNNWFLVNYKGAVGWIAAENTTLYDGQTDIEIEILDKYGYVSTGKNKGTRLFASYDVKDIAASLPECAKLRVLALKNDFVYVKCDYAAGWIKKEEIKNSYDEALLSSKEEKKYRYTLIKEAFLMSVPSEEELIDNKEVIKLKKGTQFEALRIVTTQKTEWVMLSYKGKMGWIKLSDAKKNLTPFQIGIALAAIAVFVITIGLIIMIIKRRRNRK